MKHNKVMSTTWLPAFLLAGFGEVLWQTVLWLARCLQVSPFQGSGFCCRKLEVLVNLPVPSCVSDSLAGDLANWTVISLSLVLLFNFITIIVILMFWDLNSQGLHLEPLHQSFSFLGWIFLR
jgi:hypothetical protein